MILSLRKLEIIVLDRYFQKCLEALQRLAYLHLETIPLTSSEQDKHLTRMNLTQKELQQREIVTEIYQINDELKVFFKNPEISGIETKVEEIKALTLDDRLRLSKDLLRKLKSFRRQYRNIKDDQMILSKYDDVAEFVKSFDLFHDDYEVLLFISSHDEGSMEHALQSEMGKFSPGSVKTASFKLEKNKNIKVVICSKELVTEIKKMAWDDGVIEFTLPLAYRGKKITESLRQMESDLETLKAELKDIDDQRESLIKENNNHFIAMNTVCFEEIQRLNALKNFVKGNFIRVLHVWVAVDKLEEVASVVNAVSENSAVINELERKQTIKETPVVLKNPRFARPFEIILKIFPPPTYGTLDPTLLIAIAMPLFYGLIVGDIAYGVFVLILALLVGKKFRNNETMRSATLIAVYCSISAIIFGCIFSEFLGDFGRQSLGLWDPIFDREKEGSIIALLALTLGIGIIHLSIGLILGIINARLLDDKHTLFERAGQLLCMISVLVLISGLAWFGSFAYGLAAIFFGCGISLLLYGKGALGLLELLGLITNVFSYSRLMALGLASVIIAKVANVIFVSLNTGIGGFIVGLVFSLALHGLNIVMIIFSPTIHILRLHYVEFFEKFYKTGGKEYITFGKKNKLL